MARNLGMSPLPIYAEKSYSVGDTRVDVMSWNVYEGLANIRHNASRLIDTAVRKSYIIRVRAKEFPRSRYLCRPIGIRQINAKINFLRHGACVVERIEPLCLRFNVCKFQYVVYPRPGETTLFYGRRYTIRNVVS